MEIHDPTKTAVQEAISTLVNRMDRRLDDYMCKGDNTVSHEEFVLMLNTEAAHLLGPDGHNEREVTYPLPERHEGLTRRL